MTWGKYLVTGGFYGVGYSHHGFSVGTYGSQQWTHRYENDSVPRLISQTTVTKTRTAKPRFDAHAEMFNYRIRYRYQNLTTGVWGAWHYHITS